VSALIGRPHADLRVTSDRNPRGSFRVSLKNRGRGAPIRGVLISLGYLDARGIVNAGDGMSWPQEIYPPLGISFELYVGEGQRPHSDEGRYRSLSLDRRRDLICEISWQRPLIPWTRVRRVIVWKDDAGRAHLGGEPEKLTPLRGRAARKAVKETQFAPGW
jgi:hypothetical protein